MPILVSPPPGGAPTAAQLYLPFCTILSITANSALTQVIDTAIPRDLTIAGASALSTFLPTSFNATGTPTVSITGAALSQASVIAFLDACIADGGNNGALSLQAGTSWAPPVQSAAVVQIEDFAFVGDAGIDGVQNNDYFTFLDQAGADYYVWFNLAGSGVDPAPSGTGIEVAFTFGTASEVAAFCVAAINGVVGTITASNSISPSTLRLTQISGGSCNDGASFATGVTHSIATNGANVVKHAKVETLLSGLDGKH